MVSTFEILNSRGSIAYLPPFILSSLWAFQRSFRSANLNSYKNIAQMTDSNRGYTHSGKEELYI